MLNLPHRVYFLIRNYPLLLIIRFFFFKNRNTGYVKSISINISNKKPVLYAFVQVWASKFETPFYCYRLFTVFYRLHTSLYHPRTDGLVERFHRN